MQISVQIRINWNCPTETELGNNKASLSSSETVLELPTGTELGNSSFPLPDK